MTDKEKLLALLAEFGVEPVIDSTNYTPASVVLEGGTKGLVRGYSGFFCEFEFSENGKFQRVGVWE